MCFIGVSFCHNSVREGKEWTEKDDSIYVLYVSRAAEVLVRSSELSKEKKRKERFKNSESLSCILLVHLVLAEVGVERYLTLRGSMDVNRAETSMVPA
jgi:hypothetical protein